MRPDERIECPPTQCLAAYDRPCREWASVAMVIGAVVDAAGPRSGVTWGQLTEWIPDMTPDHISETVITCLKHNWLDVASHGESEAWWVLFVTGAGWITLSDLVADNPTQLGWATIMPHTFRPAHAVGVGEMES